MGARSDKLTAVLVVTGPARERLYERFRRLYAGRGDVTVVLDRRSGERRRAAVPAAAERRRGSPWLVFPPDSAAG